MISTQVIHSISSTLRKLPGLGSRDAWASVCFLLVFAESPPPPPLLEIDLVFITIRFPNLSLVLLGLAYFSFLLFKVSLRKVLSSSCLVLVSPVFRLVLCLVPTVRLLLISGSSLPVLVRQGDRVRVAITRARLRLRP